MAPRAAGGAAWLLATGCLLAAALQRADAAAAANATQGLVWQPLSSCNSWAVNNARYAARAGACPDLESRDAQPHAAASPLRRFAALQVTGAAYVEVDVAPDSYATRYTGSTANGSMTCVP